MRKSKNGPSPAGSPRAWSSFIPKVVVLLSYGLLSSTLQFAADAPVPEPNSRLTKKADVGKDLFEQNLLPKLRIVLSDKAVEALLTRPRTYILGSVIEGNTTYTNVSIRLKGGPGSFRRFLDKPAFTLNFARRAEGQRFHGLRKIHLNNSVQDSTFLAERYSRLFFNAAGVPTPRAGHALVECNDRNLGMYVLIEGIDKPFLKRHFADATGNLYDGHSGSDVTRIMPLNSGDYPKDHSKLNSLAAAIRVPGLAERRTAIEKHLDIPRFISFLATEVVLAHWDGYAMNRNNFRVFHDRAQDRLVFLPQGADQVFRRQDISLYPNMQGAVANAVLDVPAFRKQYEDRVANLVTNVFPSILSSNQIAEDALVVQKGLDELRTSSGTQYQSRVSSFSRSVQQRLRSFQRRWMPVETGSSSPLGPLAWQRRTDLGTPQITESMQGDRRLLQINAEDKSASSWRTTASLDTGHYRFEGMMKLEGIILTQGDAKTGVGLRLSHRPFPRSFPKDMEWSKVHLDFDVDGEADVELICELRASGGRATFDAQSFHIIRRPE